VTAPDRTPNPIAEFFGWLFMAAVVVVLIFGVLPR
jgi:hypothetical protein